MKALLAIAFSVLLSNILNAQGFIKKNYTQYYEAYSYGVAQTSYGYIMAGGITDTSRNGIYGSLPYTVMGVDTLGNQLWLKNYGDSSSKVFLGSADYIKKVANYYYSAISKDYGNNVWFSSFLKLDEWGDTLWTKEYKGDAADSILIIDNFTKTYSGGFILGGRVWNASTSIDSKVILINIDSLGTVVWKKKYNLLTSIGGEYISSIVQDSTTRQIFFTGSRGYTVYKSVFCTVDSAGNNITTKYINEPYGGELLTIKQLHDGNFIAAGAYNTANSVGGFVMRKSALRKLDINGNTLWHKEFGVEGIGNNFASIEVLAGDTLIVGGSTDTTYARGLGFNDMFQLCKIAPNGTIIWCTQVDINPPNTYQDVYHGLGLAKSSGYLMTGYLTNSSPTPFILVKTDANGCVQTNCRATALAQEQPSVGLVLYPNPASNEINITCPNYVTDAHIVFTNVLGETVLQSNLKTGVTTLTTQSVAQGFYTATVYVQGKATEQYKIVINK